MRFVWACAKFGTFTVVSVNVTLAEDKMCTLALESTHFIFNKCPISITHDGASAKFSTNSHETDYSAVVFMLLRQKIMIVLAQKNGLLYLPYPTEQQAWKRKHLRLYMILQLLLS